LFAVTIITSPQVFLLFLHLLSFSIMVTTRKQDKQVALGEPHSKALRSSNNKEAPATKVKVHLFL
jgi:hypothetical protein